MACNPGDYGPYVGAQSVNDCIPCKPGFYCLGEDAKDATSLCKAGYYCSGGTMTYNLQKAKPTDLTETVYIKAGIA